MSFPYEYTHSSPALAPCPDLTHFVWNEKKINDSDQNSLLNDDKDVSCLQGLFFISSMIQVILINQNSKNNTDMFTFSTVLRFDAAFSNEMVSKLFCSVILFADCTYREILI